MIYKPKRFKETEAETHGAGLPARRLSSIAFLSAANRQNVSKATVGRSKTPLMVIGFASVALFAAPRLEELLLLLDSERDATSKSVSRSTYSSFDVHEPLIGFFRCLYEALFSEGFLRSRRAGILYHVRLAGDG